MSKKLNIGALSKLTSIPTETLRTWERRYGFPVAERTESGHRRYSDDAVQRLVCVRELLAQGYKPSEILSMDLEQLRSLASRRVELAGEMSSRLASSPATSPIRPIEDASTVDELVEFARDMRSGALQRSFEMMWHRHGATMFLENTAPQFLKSIGNAWSTGDICVEHEHMASECLLEFLSGKWRPLSESAREPIVICATPPGELHTLGLHLVALSLALANVKIVFLGANTPAESIAGAALQQKETDTQQAIGIALSATSSLDPTSLTLCVAEIHTRAPNVPIIIGGEGAPVSLTHATSAHSVGEAQIWARNLGV